MTPLALDSSFNQEGLFIPFDDSILLLQFTGCLDRNGKEIYEGDVKRDMIESLEGDHYVYAVCSWIQEWSRFSWLNIQEYIDYQELGKEALDEILQETYGVFTDEQETTVVIGNIYEKPEYLTDYKYRSA